MRRYVLRRIAGAIPLILGIATLVFFLVRLAPGDPVLIWGGAGGLGSMGIQIVREMGGIPIAVISGEEKVDFCEKLGARGCIDRREFDHWGMPPHPMFTNIPTEPPMNILSALYPRNY